MLDKLFKRTKWETIYFAQNIDEFYKIKGKLVANHIETKTKTIGSTFGGRGGMGFGRGQDSFEILVKADDLFIANEAINNCR